MLEELIRVGLGDTLIEMYERAERDGITTAEAAERIARARLIP